MEKKYILTDETMKVGYYTFHRIVAVRDFGGIRAGTIGGFVESEKNLSHGGTCWVHGNAQVFEDAKVSEDAVIFEGASVFGHANVFGNANVYGNVSIYGDSKVFGNAIISEDANIYGNAIVCENAAVFEHAQVYGYANVSGDACVYGYSHIGGGHVQVSKDAHIFGNSVVYGESKIGKNGYIQNSKCSLSVGPIGGRDGYATFYLTHEKKIMVYCAWFNDTIEEFKKCVNDTFKNNKLFLQQYMTSCEYAETMLMLDNN